MNPRFVWINWSRSCNTEARSRNTAKAATNAIIKAYNLNQVPVITHTGGQVKRCLRDASMGVRANLGAARALPRIMRPAGVPAGEGVAA